jgi:hypothetical protein
MTHHKASQNKNKAKHKLISTAILAAVIATGATQSHALGGVVSDALVRKYTGQMATSNNFIATEEKKQTKLQQKQLDAMGEAGSGMSLVNNPAWETIGSESSFYSNMDKFDFDMCAINLCQVGDNPSDTDDIEEARDWAMKTFFSSKALEPKDKRDLVEVRRRALAYTSANGFALSNIIHNDLASGGGTAQALDNIVDSSTSFRGDIQANSAVSLAHYRVAVQQLAVLSAILDIEASRAVNDAELYHEDGGDEFPDAYIDADYQHDGGRIRVTIPDKGTAD